MTFEDHILRRTVSKCKDLVIAKEQSFERLRKFGNIVDIQKDAEFFHDRFERCHKKGALDIDGVDLQWRPASNSILFSILYLVKLDSNPVECSGLFLFDFLGWRFHPVIASRGGAITLVEGLNDWVRANIRLLRFILRIWQGRRDR